MSEDLSMWGYWRDKRGSASEAVESDFPNTLVNDPVLQASVNQIKALELAIDARMEQLADEQKEEDDEH